MQIPDMTAKQATPPHCNNISKDGRNIHPSFRSHPRLQPEVDKLGMTSHIRMQAPVMTAKQAPPSPCNNMLKDGRNIHPSFRSHPRLQPEVDKPGMTSHVHAGTNQGTPVHLNHLYYNS